MGLVVNELKEVSQGILSTLAPAIALCKKRLGVSTFGYRRFLVNGKSFGFSDNHCWNKVCAEHFTGVHNPEYAKNLNRYILCGETHLIRRGIPDANNPFLQALYETNVWNTFCLYIKNSEHHFIEAFFFGATTEDNNIIESYIDHLDFIHRWSEDVRVMLAPFFNERSTTYFSNTITEPDCLEGLKKFFLKDFENHCMNALQSLSDREREIACLLIKGYKRREIALDLDVSPKTVDANLEHIKDKTSSLTKMQCLEFLKMPKVQSFLNVSGKKGVFF